MVQRGSTQKTILTVLSDSQPRSHRQIVDATKMSDKVVESALYRLWNKGLILRTNEPLRETLFMKLENKLLIFFGQN